MSEKVHDESEYFEEKCKDTGKGMGSIGQTHLVLFIVLVVRWDLVVQRFVDLLSFH